MMNILIIANSGYFEMKAIGLGGGVEVEAMRPLSHLSLPEVTD